MNWQDIVYWNQQSYGSAIKITRARMIYTGLVICLVTPFTNWLIPILPKLIKKDWRIRY